MNASVLESFVGRRAIYAEKPIYLAVSLRSVVQNGETLTAELVKIEGSLATSDSQDGATFSDSSMWPDQFKAGCTVDDFWLPQANVWAWSGGQFGSWRLYFIDAAVDAFLKQDPQWGRHLTSPAQP